MLQSMPSFSHLCVGATSQQGTHDTEAASLARLEAQVARLSRRVEVDVAELESPANIPSGDVRQRQGSQRRREELAQQVRQLTDSLAEKEEAMQEQKNSSIHLHNRSVGTLASSTYAGLLKASAERAATGAGARGKAVASTTGGAAEVGLARSLSDVQRQDAVYAAAQDALKLAQGLMQQVEEMRGQRPDVHMRSAAASVAPPAQGKGESGSGRERRSGGERAAVDGGVDIGEFGSTDASTSPRDFAAVMEVKNHTVLVSPGSRTPLPPQSARSGTADRPQLLSQQLRDLMRAEEYSEDCELDSELFI
jgi:hypothetical protein